jgi:aminoglycoside phosphotransferase (APT) family kinase protein
MCHINQCFPELDHGVTSGTIASAWQQRIAAALRLQSSAGISSDRVDALFAAIVKQLDGVPTTVSHNDLYWGNMAAAGHTGLGAWRVIDFGTVDVNVAGAELHHFAYASMRDDSRRQWCDALTAAYAAETGFDLPALQLASFSYAFYRCTDRIVRYACRSQVEYHAQELLIFDRLCGKLTQLLGRTAYAK